MDETVERCAKYVESAMFGDEYTGPDEFMKHMAVAEKFFAKRLRKLAVRLRRDIGGMADDLATAELRKIATER